MRLRSRLIPGFISIWGLIAAALVLISTITGWFSPELGESLGMITGLPMLLNELFLGIWLVTRGFIPSAIASEPARQFTLEVRDESLRLHPIRSSRSFAAGGSS